MTGSRFTWKENTNLGLEEFTSELTNSKECRTLLERKIMSKEYEKMIDVTYQMFEGGKLTFSEPMTAYKMIHSPRQSTTYTFKTTQR